MPFSTPAPASVRSVPKKQEQQVTAAPTSVPVSETVVSSTNARENGNLEAEGMQFIILLFNFISVSYPSICLLSNFGFM